MDACGQILMLNHRRTDSNICLYWNNVQVLLTLFNTHFVTIVSRLCKDPVTFIKCTQFIQYSRADTSMGYNTSIGNSHALYLLETVNRNYTHFVFIS